MTPREQKRARAIYMKFRPTKHIDDWPDLRPVELLTMPFRKLVKLLPSRGPNTAMKSDC